MEPQLPPQDPNDWYGLSPDVGLELNGPTAVFAAGPPSAEVDRLADALLEFRPGALIVLVR
jgi:hypothetical protein